MKFAGNFEVLILLFTYHEFVYSTCYFIANRSVSPPASFSKPQIISSKVERNLRWKENPIHLPPLLHSEIQIEKGRCKNSSHLEFLWHHYVGMFLHSQLMRSLGNVSSFGNCFIVVMKVFVMHLAALSGSFLENISLEYHSIGM